MAELEPRDRHEAFLNAIATKDGSDLPKPRDREEAFLQAIYEATLNGGGGGGSTSDFEAELAKKQDKLKGTAGQVVGFDAEGNAVAQEAPSGGGGEVEKTGIIIASVEKARAGEYLNYSGGFLVSLYTPTREQLIGGVIYTDNQDFNQETITADNVDDFFCYNYDNNMAHSSRFANIVTTPNTTFPVAGVYIHELVSFLFNKFLAFTYTIKGYPADWELIENRPFGTIEHDVSWDGNTEGKAIAGLDMTPVGLNPIPYYKLSDLAPVMSDILPVAISGTGIVDGVSVPIASAGTTSADAPTGAEIEIVRVNDNVDAITYQNTPVFFLVREASSVTLTWLYSLSITFPETGLYCVDFAFAAQELGVDSIAEVSLIWSTIKTIDPIYLPPATETTLGAVKGKPKTTETVEVAVDKGGKMWVPESSGGKIFFTDTDPGAGSELSDGTLLVVYE